MKSAGLPVPDEGPEFMTRELIKVGNPGLRPQFSTQAELGYKAAWSTGSALPRRHEQTSLNPSFTFASFVALIGYDWSALRYVRRSLPPRVIALASFCGYAIWAVLRGRRAQPTAWLEPFPP